MASDPGDDPVALRAKLERWRAWSSDKTALAAQLLNLLMAEEPPVVMPRHMTSRPRARRSSGISRSEAARFD